MSYVGIGTRLIRLAPYLTGLAYDIYQLSEREDASAGVTARRCQVVLSRNNSEDVITNTYDFVNITSGVTDNTWTSGDYSGIEARLRTFYAALTGYLSGVMTLREFRWHMIPDTPGDTAALRVAPPATALALSASTSLPPQVAVTLTKQTRSRKHWGRVYLGPLGQNALATSTTTGRFSTTFVDAVATAANTLRAGLQADDTPMVVFDRTRLHLATVDSVRVDDIPDIQRSRRPDWQPYRKLLP